MQETNVVNMGGVRFYWQMSRISAIALKLILKLIFLNYHCWTNPSSPAKKGARCNTMMLQRSVGRAAVITIRIVVDTTVMAPIFVFANVAAFLQYV